MRFEPTALPGVVVIEAEPRGDARGFFARLYDPTAFALAGIRFAPTQINLSRNKAALTLRGMHFQRPPYAEAKLVRVTRGRAHDVVVDLRPDSPAYRRWIAVELDAISARALFVPQGCAHGFLTLTPATDLLYQMGQDHVPGHAAGLRWNDPGIGIVWPGEPAILSEADRNWPDFAG
jgi:dTDP-4-dehydrorhamnose 3,5-epimerase